MTNDERLRSLTLIHCIAIGCLRMVPRIDSKEVLLGSSSVASCDSKYQAQYSVYAKEPSKAERMWSFFSKLFCSEFKENLRMRLIVDLGFLLGKPISRYPQVSPSAWVSRIDHLISHHSDDASSIKVALKVTVDVFIIDCIHVIDLDIFSFFDLLRHLRSGYHETMQEARYAQIYI